MTLTEFSVQFDILYNNIFSNQAPGLTEYEKSVFLTQAQEALVLDLYKGTAGDSFETTEEVTRYLSSLVKSEEIKNPTVTPNTKYNYSFKTKKEDVWFVVFQSAVISVDLNNSRDVLVVPTTHDTLYKDLKNPFKGPNKNKVLITNDENGINIYSKYPISSWYMKYLSRPTPIILEDLDNGLTIENISSNTECVLPESLHQQIILRAVQMAKAVWVS